MTEESPGSTALVVLAAVFAPARVAALFSRLAEKERGPLGALAARAASAPRAQRLAALAAAVADLERAGRTDTGAERPRIAEVIARCGPFRPGAPARPAPSRALGRLLMERRTGRVG